MKLLQEKAEAPKQETDTIVVSACCLSSVQSTSFVAFDVSYGHSYQHYITFSEFFCFYSYLIYNHTDCGLYM